MTPLQLFIILIFAHQLGDQPLQTTHMVECKRGRIAGCPQWLGLLYHAFMHGALVLLVTDSMLLFFAELAAHYWIDREKQDGHIGMKIDQALHIFCKAVWVLYIFCYLN